LRYKVKGAKGKASTKAKAAAADDGVATEKQYRVEWLGYDELTSQARRAGYNQLPDSVAWVLNKGQNRY
jgi:hypothetical protein